MDGPFGGESGRCVAGLSVGQLPVEEVVGGVGAGISHVARLLPRVIICLFVTFDPCARF